MSSGSKEVTVGYRYYASMHLALAHGPIDKYLSIRIGDKIAWTGNITDDGSIFINQEYLFGGDDREGGVVGAVDLIMGSSGQDANEYLAQTLPDAAPLPAFRSVAAMVLKDVYLASNNPNIRPWTPEVLRIPAKGWYDAKALVGNYGGVNPAHIIVECLTDVVWGLGYSINDVDQASFQSAADTLFTENFGMSLIWHDQGTIQDFLAEIIRHISASLFVDPRTGLFKLLLVRDDYDRDTLPILGEDNVIDLEDFERIGPSEMINQLTVVWHDQVINKKRSITVHNMAAREVQGSPVGTTREYMGIPDRELAAKIAERDLRISSTALSRIVITTNKTASELTLGTPFKFNWPDLGIQDVVYRVGKLEYGEHISGTLRISAVEDVFSMGEGMYIPPAYSLWQDPISLPTPAPVRKVFEVPYVHVAWASGELDAIIGGLDTTAGLVAGLATRPSPDAFNYEFWTKTGANAYTYRDDAAFSQSGTLLSNLKVENTSVFSVRSVDRLQDNPANSLALLGDEWVELISAVPDAMAANTYTVTCNRGVLDTVPVAHGTGDLLTIVRDLMSNDLTEWLDGTTVDCKMLVKTGKGTLTLADAPVNSLTIGGRWVRPYPPGKFQINGAYWPTGVITGDIVVTWAHRDRTVQLSPDFLEQTANSVGPEAGVTYTLRVYSSAGVLKRTVAGVTGTTWTYTSAMESVDVPGAYFKIRLYSVRDGLESWTYQEAVIRRVSIGYGYGYGLFYGGVA